MKILLLCTSLGLVSCAAAQPGYTDTPMLHDSPWRVHDSARPRPAVVTPAPPTDPVPPPSDAIVLFGGNDLSAWTGKSGKAEWAIEEGAMQANKTGDIQTRESFGDIQLHLEWRTPPDPDGEGQARGNSGVFLMGRYEIQILDSYQNETYADGQAAALYGQHPPLVNASRKPGEWQTYDLVFHAPRFDGRMLKAPATVTLLHNGVLVQAHAAFLGATAHRTLPNYEPHAATGPIRLQDHGDPVAFRNIWVRRLLPPDGEGATSARGAVEAVFEGMRARKRETIERYLTGACRRQVALGEAGFLSMVLGQQLALENWALGEFDASGEQAEAMIEAVVRDGTSKSAHAVQVVVVRRGDRWLIDEVR